MISNSSAKSCRCIGSSLASAARRPVSVSARIISRTATMRSPSKNICSVRQRPMPSAPKLRATRASAACRRWRARSCGAPRRPSPSGWRNRPTVPAAHRHLALQHLAVAAVDGDDVALFQRDAAGDHGLRRHSRRGSCRRPTRRACPCRARRRPHARSCRRASSGCPRPHACRGCLPGEVSMRTRITLRPTLERLLRFVGGEDDLPQAAPGEAGGPIARRLRCALGSIVGCSNWSSESGSIRATASSLRDQPFARHIDGDLSDAVAVRLPLRVCSIQSLPRSTVNSMSCMSR